MRLKKKKRKRKKKANRSQSTGKRLERNNLGGRIIGIETVDKMTDRQIAAGFYKKKMAELPEDELLVRFAFFINSTVERGDFSEKSNSYNCNSPVCIYPYLNFFC